MMPANDATTTFDAKLDAYLAVLNAACAAKGEEIRFAVETGIRYVRVFHHLRGAHRSVVSFIDKRTGNFHRAASWKGPVKVPYGVNLMTLDLATVGRP